MKLARKEEREKYNDEKEFIMKDLESKVKKILMLEIKIKSQAEIIQEMEGQSESP